MNFREKVDGHIEETLTEGVLPDVDDVLEMEIPGQQRGPQKSGDEGGPKSARATEATYTDHTVPPSFGGASRGKKFPCLPFSNANRDISPAKFRSAAKFKEAAVQAVLADLETMQNAE